MICKTSQELFYTRLYKLINYLQGNLRDVESRQCNKHCEKKTDFGIRVDLNNVGPQNVLVAKHYPETYAHTF